MLVLDVPDRSARLFMTDVVLMRCEARVKGVWPADALQPAGDLSVVQVGMVAALAADEFKCVGVAAFHPAVYDTGWLAPEARCPAMGGLTSKRQAHESFGVKAQPRVTGTGRDARSQDGIVTVRQLAAGRDIAPPDRPSLLALCHEIRRSRDHTAWKGSLIGRSQGPSSRTTGAFGPTPG